MHLYSFIPSVFTKGNLCHCNICGYKAKFFLKRGHDFPIIKALEIIGAGKRNVDCIQCGSSDRDRLIAAYFLSEYNNNQLAEKKLLHIAPEKALSKLFKNTFHMQVTAADAKIGYAQFLYGKNVLEIDLCQLPFQSATFDVVVANHVLEHVSNASTAISEIARVLKPNGIAITQVPLSKKIKQSIEALPHWDKQDKINHLGQSDHLRLFGEDFANKLSEHGLKPDFWQYPPNNEMVQLGLNANESLLKSVKM